MDWVDWVEYHVVSPLGPEVNGRCCFSGMRGGATSPEGGVEGVLTAIELTIGWESVGPPGAGGTLKIDVSGKA